MPTFQSALHWELFMMTDRLSAFMIGPTKQNGLGDADFRSMTVPFIMKKENVISFSDVGYAHPVAWDEQYDPNVMAGISGGGE